MLNLVQGLKDQQDKLEANVDELTIKVVEIAAVKDTRKEKVCRVVMEELCEGREKEAKSANVLIRYFKEINRDEDGGWKDDRELLEHLVHNVLEQKEVEEVSVTRVPDMEDRNILTVVTLGNSNMKMKVLRVTNNLRDKDEWGHVFISAYETTRERDKLYQL